MTSNDAATLAWAEALEAWSATAATLAERLRDTVTDESSAMDRTSKLGPRQREVLNLSALNATEGTSLDEVAEALGVALPNAHRLLTGLAGRELIEEIPDTKPRRWRKPLPDDAADDGGDVAFRP